MSDLERLQLNRQPEEETHWEGLCQEAVDLLREVFTGGIFKDLAYFGQTGEEIPIESLVAYTVFLADRCPLVIFAPEELLEENPMTVSDQSGSSSLILNFERRNSVRIILPDSGVTFYSHDVPPRLCRVPFHFGFDGRDGYALGDIAAIKDGALNEDPQCEVKPKFMVAFMNFSGKIPGKHRSWHGFVVADPPSEK